ncbi:LOW QUALITY PROTEIN: uncharacterized protein LOC135103650 [Scylla paramamosain]|uniref:LOW QUALITY PROTEIN: uncharacterized protein LOC135103650 n=1 Tax=Scylla paramamosain TaxID=85552 RepID=UPI0030836EC9
MTQGNISRQLLLLQVLLILGGSEAFDPEASITGLYTGPYFDPLSPRNMTAHLGDEAKLPCTVRQLGDKSVSWVRVRDADILTVDRYTFVGDERFESHYSAQSETWNLVIRYVQERDAGEYECQVSTEPKMSQFFSLRVVIPKVKILPMGDRYVKAGSTVRIDCQITDVVQLPDYIFWYHQEKRVMARHDPNLTVKVKRTDVEAITSTLTIHKVRQEQSGNYTCMPSNLHSASVVLHVINEKHPAAMQGERNGSGAAEAKIHVTFLILLLLFVFTVSLGVREETYRPKPKKRLATNPASVAVLSPATKSSMYLSPITALSPPSLPCLSHHVPTATSSQGEQEAFDILWKLLKIDALHRAQEVRSTEGDDAKSVPSDGSLTRAMPFSNRPEEMLNAEGCPSSSLKRRAPQELIFDEAQEPLNVLGKERVEETKASRTRVASPQPHQVPPMSQIKGFRGVGRRLGVASCR